MKEMLKSVSRVVLVAVILAIALGISGLSSNVGMFLGLVLFVLVLGSLLRGVIPEKYVRPAVAFAVGWPVVVIGGSLLWSSVIYPIAPPFWDQLSARWTNGGITAAEVVRPEDAEGHATDYSGFNTAMETENEEHAKNIAAIEKARREKTKSNVECDALVKYTREQHEQIIRSQANVYGVDLNKLHDQSSANTWHWPAWTTRGSVKNMVSLLAAIIVVLFIAGALYKRNHRVIATAVLVIGAWFLLQAVIGAIV